jgi:hypothetical protein
MRGRKLSYDPLGWDEHIWKVVYSDDHNDIVQDGLTAGEAMRLSAEINVVARRRGERLVEVVESPRL